MPEQEFEYLPFGPALRRRRKLAGLNQDDLGEMLGIDQTAISRWERLEVPFTDRFKLEELADALNQRLETTVDDLIKGRVPVRSVKARPLGTTEPTPINPEDWRGEIFHEEAPHILPAERQKWLALLDDLPPAIREDLFKLGEHYQEMEHSHKKRRRTKVPEVQAAYHVEVLDKDAEQQRAEG